MADWISVPLGVDLGSSRIRIAAGERNREGELRVRAVAARDIPEGLIGATDVNDPAVVAAIVDDIVHELGVKERRCVLALGAPGAVVRYVKFPKMHWAERLRAARFESQRWPGFDEQASTVRVHPVQGESDVFAVGATHTKLLEGRVGVVKAAGLRPVAVDHESCALRRVFPVADAVVDIGARRSVIHLFGAPGPIAAFVDAGGEHVTELIARDLSLDLGTAEKRKRILGCAGAGSEGQDRVVAALAAVVERMRSRASIETIAVTGNGARLPNLVRDLGQATGALAHMPVPAMLEAPAYPLDVVRAAAPDWSLAAGILAWSAA